MYCPVLIIKLCLLCLLNEARALYSVPEFSAVGEGGKAVAINIAKVPYMARYEPKYQYFNEHYCGASIVHEQFLVTAASCALSFKPDVECVVNVGTDYTGLPPNKNTGVLYEVDSVHPHPKFNKTAANIYSSYTVNVSDYDVAVIKLKKKLEYGKKVQPIKMADIGTEYKEGDGFDFLGFGTADPGNRTHFLPDYLLKIEENLFNHEKCKEVWKNYTKTDIVTERHICAGGKRGTGACWFDWGGPLTKKDTLVGVMSFFGRPCAGGLVPDVFISVAAVRPFIDEIIKSNVTIEGEPVVTIV